MNEKPIQYPMEELEELIKEMRNIKAIQKLLTGNYPNDKIISRMNKARINHLVARAKELANRVRKEEMKAKLSLVGEGE